jgi:hypothetical protein
VGTAGNERNALEYRNPQPRPHGCGLKENTMNASLFKELKKYMATSNDSTLNAIVRRHATEAQRKQLGAPAQGRKVKSTPAQVPDNTITVVMGPYGTEVQARAEAEQFKHPQVFLYRSAIFPNPVNFKVTTRVVDSQAVRTTGGNVLYPFGVQLKLKVDGDPDKVRSWIDAFKTRARPLTMM